MSRIFSISTANKTKKQFDAFSESTIRAVKRNQKIDAYKFSTQLQDFGDSFVSVGQNETMNKVSKSLAETLVGLNNDKLASIVYSYLIKFNVGNEKAIEEFAINGLRIAKRQHDPIHIMARTNDLKNIYKKQPFSQEKFLKVLFEEKRALNEIITNYDGVQRRYNSLTRKMRPVESYKEKLAAIKLDIAKVLVSKNDKHNTNQAIIELQEAFSIYEEIGMGKNSDEIKGLLIKLIGE